MLSYAKLIINFLLAKNLKKFDAKRKKNTSRENLLDPAFPYH